MNYLPRNTVKNIFLISEALALALTIIVVTDSANEGAGASFIGIFIFLSIAFNGGIYLVSLILQAIKNAGERDRLKTELLKDEYNRMEARKRLDKEDN